MTKFLLFGGIALFLVSVIMLLVQFMVPNEYDDFYEDVMGTIGIISTFLLVISFLCLFG